MVELAALIDSLRRITAVGIRPQETDEADGWLGAGLAAGRYHELFATDPDDVASGAGFAVATAMIAGAMPLFWLRTVAVDRAGGRLHGGGLAELGCDPAAITMAVVADEKALLKAAADAARCPGIGTLLIEAWGRAPGIDLTATRRLMLAAEASGVTTICLRVDAEPSPSAAATRWRIAAAPSVPLAANAPGGPAFLVECLRRRGAAAGGHWLVEWNRDARNFVPLTDPAAGRVAAPLPGASLPLVAGGAAARHPRTPVRRTG